MKRKKSSIGNLQIAATTSIKHLLLSCLTCALVATAAPSAQRQQHQNSYHHHQQQQLSRHSMRQIPLQSLASSAFNHRTSEQFPAEGLAEFEADSSNGGLAHRQHEVAEEPAAVRASAAAYRTPADQDEDSGLAPDTASAGSISSVGLDSSSDSASGGNLANSAATSQSASENNNNKQTGLESPAHASSSFEGGSSSSSENSDAHDHDESADNSQEIPERNVFIDHHNSQLQAMHDLFERRQLNSHNPLQSSQELSPMTIGLDAVTGAGSPFNMPPFSVPNHQDGPPPMPLSKLPMANADNIDQGLGPSLPFGLNHLPHLLGFQSHPFDGPQRGDQSAHTNHHAALPPPLPAIDQETGPSQKVWPKIFRFTDGRINLSDFEKQKKIRLSSKNQHNNDNHIESAPIMFDGRQLKRKSFLILHGGIFSK